MGKSPLSFPLTLIAILFLIVGALTLSLQQRQALKTSAIQGVTSELIQWKDFTYDGSFYMDSTGAGASRFNYGWGNIAVNPAGDNGKGSLFMSGHIYDNLVAEASIPTPVKIDPKGSLQDLPPSKILQQFKDVTSGQLAAMQKLYGSTYIGGLAVHKPSGFTSPQLFWTTRIYYNVSGHNPSAHGASSTNLSAPGTKGQWHVDGGHNMMAGFLSPVPQDFADQYLGGRSLLTGQSGVAGNVGSSWGPVAFAIKPWLGSGEYAAPDTNIPALPLVYYPINKPFGKFDGSSRISDMEWISTGSKHALAFVGTIGTGHYWYGGPTDGKYTDPCIQSKGQHNSEFETHLYLYSPDDLLKVAAGTVKPWEIKPYEDVNISSSLINYCAGSIGITYDPTKNRLFIMQMNGRYKDWEFAPVVHVFTLSGTPAPAAAAPAEIKNLTQSVADTEVTFVWQTTAAISLRLDFALADDFKKPLTVTSPEGTDHSIKLTDLVACTVYRYKLTSLSDSSKATEKGKFTTSGCIGKASVQDETSATLDAKQGGKLRFTNDAVVLDAPADFNTADTNFQIKRLDRTQVETATSKPEGLNALSSWYQIHALEDPSALKSSFNQPLSITLAYTIDDSVPADTIKAYRHDGTSWEALTDCTVNQEAKTITCTLDHFSLFGVFGGGSFTAPAPTPTPVIIAQNVSSGGDSGGGGGGGGGGGDEASSEPAPSRIYTYQAEKGILTGLVIKKDGKLTIAFFTKDTDRLAQAYKVDAGTYRLSFSAKDGLPKGTKIAIYLNNKAWKTVTLSRGDNKYREIIAGSLKSLRTGTISFRLVSPLPNQTLSLDWWRLTQVK